MYYSLIDEQTGSLMSVGRNSKTLDELFWSKMDYHEDLEELDESTGEIIPFHQMYHKTVEGMVTGCFDFEFHIVKHQKEIPDEDFDRTTQNWGEIDFSPMTYNEAVNEFKEAVQE